MNAMTAMARCVDTGTRTVHVDGAPVALVLFAHALPPSTKPPPETAIRGRFVFGARGRNGNVFGGASAFLERGYAGNVYWPARALEQVPRPILFGRLFVFQISLNRGGGVLKRLP